jgi:hypothetical protein
MGDDFEELIAQATIAGDLTEALSSLADGAHDVVVEDGFRLRVTIINGIPAHWRAFREGKELSTLVILSPPTPIHADDPDGGTGGCQSCGYVCAARGGDGGMVCWKECWPREC